MYTGLFLETSFKMNKILLGVSLFSGLILINQGCFAATEKADQQPISYLIPFWFLRIVFIYIKAIR